MRPLPSANSIGDALTTPFRILLARALLSADSMRRRTTLLPFAFGIAVATGAAVLACSSAGGGDGAPPPPPSGEVDGSTTAPVDPPSEAGPVADGGTGGDATADASADGGIAWTAVPLACSTAAPGGMVQDLGHQKEIVGVRRTSSRVLADEHGGGWILWDVAGAEVAGAVTGVVVAFSPSTFVVLDTDVELRAVSDGHVIAKLPKGASKYGVASDGSYAWSTSTASLKIFSSAGAEVASRSGNYGNAVVYGAPTELRVAKGAAGANVIERVTPAGVATVGAAFGGTFHSWFTDGAHFLATVGTTNVLVHDTLGTLVKTLPVNVTSQDKLVGQSSFVWRFKQQTPGYPLDVYALDGDGTPVFSAALSVLTTITASADEIGIFPYGVGIATVLHLDPVVGVTSTSHSTPYAHLTSFGAATDGSWAMGTRTGSLLVHGDAVSSSAERSLGCGQVLSIAGAPTGRVAVATASYHILVSDLPSGAPVADLPLASSGVQLSASGGVLAEMAATHAYQYLTDRTVAVVAIPSGTIVSTLPFAYTPQSNRFGFHMNANGDRIATSYQTPEVTIGRDVTDLTTGDIVLADSGFKPTPRLSPNGERVAMSDYAPFDDKPMSTRIYNGSALVAAVPGSAIGWLDDNRLLVQEYGSKFPIGSVYQASRVYDAAGTLVASPPLPALGESDIIDATHVFSRGESQLFEAYTGTRLGPRMPDINNGGGKATAAGPHLVGVFGRRLGRVGY